MPNRNQYIDYAKGITIILVIIPHCIQYGAGAYYLNESLFYDNPIFKFIYSFHMPVFMIISGYLFNYSITRHSFNNIIKSRITTLLIPILLWHTIYVIIQNYVDGNHSDFYWSSYIKHLWFIWAVLWSSLVILFVHKFTNDSLVVYLIIFIIFLFLPHRYNSNYYVFMYPYFLCGYLINNPSLKIINKIHTKLSTPYGLIILTTIFLIMLEMFSHEDFVYVSKTNIFLGGHISLHMLYIDLYRWIIGFIGSFLFYKTTHYCYHYFYEKPINTHLINIGTKTMGIYIISDYSFRFFYLLPINSLNYLYILIETICILGISYYTTWIIDRNYYLRKVLLGGR